MSLYNKYSLLGSVLKCTLSVRLFDLMLSILVVLIEFSFSKAPRSGLVLIGCGLLFPS